MMNQFKKLLIAILLFPTSCLGLNGCLEGTYISAFGGVTNSQAFGMNSVEPPYTIAVSPTKNSNYGGLFGVTLGYDWCQCDFPINTEFMYLYTNKQKFQMTNLYPADVQGGSGLYSEYDNLNITNNIFLINALYQWPVTCQFRPFFGAGIGLNISKVEGNFFSTVTTVPHNGFWKAHHISRFTYDLLIGISYLFCSNFEASITYQFIPLAKIRTNSVAFGNNGNVGEQTLSARQINMNNFLFGIKYKF